MNWDQDTWFCKAAAALNIGTDLIITALSLSTLRVNIKIYVDQSIRKLGAEQYTGWHAFKESREVEKEAMKQDRIWPM